MARSWRNFFRRKREPEAEPPQIEAPEETEERQEEAAEAAPPAREEPEAVRVEEPAPREPEAARVEEEEAREESEAGWFGRLRQGLRKSRESVVGQLNAAVAEFRDAEDEEFWERVEEILIASDVGVTTTAKLVGELEQEALRRNITSGEELRELLVQKAERMLSGPVELDISHKPTVILMVGVNGTGKTTTIGKLVNFLPGKVMLAAGDTFRAAAIEQLQEWGRRTGAPVIARQRGADAASVAHEAVEAAKREGMDVLIVDTAGRLHTKINLMAEMEKIGRVIGRQLPGAPHEVLLTVDATTGQNGLRQAKMFKEAIGVSGIVLTKLDGTAKGGIALAIANEIGVPIKLVSVGEKVEDLHPFDARQFAEALFGEL
ncbi:signal recognition particle-docking protein FtsY [Rubrobacter calidifluminis]|uniref:signal recognition particle-docking protein FtsY n=1 Tax=Rubrobacter calidifluminis TaxID=1392640 RepID=UPI00235FBBDB|nr:signal recognition particle-docking protein FtsY [Rubrobacter calidifluminis]